MTDRIISTVRSEGGEAMGAIIKKAAFLFVKCETLYVKRPNPKTNDASRDTLHGFLCRAGMVRFQIECDVFTNFLNSSADEQVPWNFNSRELGRIYPPLNRIFLIDV